MWSRITGLFKTPGEDTLLVNERTSNDAVSAFRLAEFYFRKDTDSSYIKGGAWLVKAIVKGCREAEELFLRDKMIMASDSMPCGSNPIRKSNMLARCMFIALMLQNRPLQKLESSGWIKTWKDENKGRFIKFNQTDSYRSLLEAIKQQDGDAQFLLNRKDSQQEAVFNEFFSYCFDIHLLDPQLAKTLGVIYSPSRGEQHGETTSLLGAGRTARYA